MNIHPAHRDATIADLVLGTWPCQQCGRTRSAHTLEGDMLRCVRAGAQVFIPVPLVEALSVKVQVTR